MRGRQRFWLNAMIAVGVASAAYVTENLRVLLAVGIGFMFFVHGTRPFTSTGRALIYVVTATALYLAALALIDRVAR